MITINETKDLGTIRDGNPVKYHEGVCRSSDPKPTNWDNGSKLLEIDTSKFYVYDAESAEWVEWGV